MDLFVVIIETEDGTSQQIDGIYPSRELAESRVEEVESRLPNMIVLVESHTLQE
jgi:hypothetical protein